MAEKILGIDLGTNSIGIALRNPNNADDLSGQLEYFSSDIFHAGAGNGKQGEYSLAAERTKHRLNRRLYETRRRRLWATLKLLINKGCCPMDPKSLEQWSTYDKARNLFRSYPISDTPFEEWIKMDFDGDGKPDYTSPYQLRRELATVQLDFSKKINLFKLGRAMYHIAQRRGFKSSKGETISSQEAEAEGETVSTDTILELKKSEQKWSHDLLALQEQNGLHTIGEAFALLEDKGERIRASQYKATRDLYEKEIKYIFQYQNGLSTDSTLYLGLTSKKKGEGTIFYRKPLRSQKRNVGKCTLEPSKKRCPQSHPEFEKFRAWSFINNIKYKKTPDDNYHELSIELKRKLYNEKFISRVCRTFPSSDISKFIKKETGGTIFNFEDRVTVSGCPVIARLRNLLGEDWEHWSKEGRRNHRAGKKSADIHQVKYTAYDLWHICFERDDPEDVKEFSSAQLGFDDQQTKNLVRLWSDINEGYAMLSLKAIKNINRMLVRGLIYSDAVMLAKVPEILELDEDSIECLIADYKEKIKQKVTNTKSLYKIANNLIADYKSTVLENRYADHNTGYVLDEDDYNDILRHIVSYYGKTEWDGMSSEYQSEVITTVSNLFQEFFRSSKRSFYQVPREDIALKDYLQAKFPQIPDAEWNKLYHPSDIAAEKPQYFKSDRSQWRLNKPLIGGMKNPVVMRTLSILRKKINDMLDAGLMTCYDTKVVIETARELNDSNWRKAIRDFNLKREKENDQIKSWLKEIYSAKGKSINDTDVDKARFCIEQSENSLYDIAPKKEPYYNLKDIKKIKLAKEQHFICMYTGNVISMAKLLDGISYDFEHTLPRSQSFDNSDMNLTVCDAHYNRQIKKNRIPTKCPNYYNDVVINGVEYKAIKPRLEMWENKIKSIEGTLFYWKKKAHEATDKDRKDLCLQQCHEWSMELQYWKSKLERFTMTEIKDGFRNRQLVDTGIITKYAVIYLKTIFNQVDVEKGIVTSVFRKMLGIQSQDMPKERSLHSHHAIDATMLTVIPVAAKRDRMLRYFYQIEEKNKILEATKDNDNREALLMEIDGLKRKIQVEIRDCRLGKTPENVADFIEEHILVNHHSRVNALNIAKRRQRVRGKVCKNEDGKDKFISSDSIRGKIHKDTFYGAITQWTKDAEGRIITDEHNHPIADKDIKFVCRVPLVYGDMGFKDWDGLKKSIVDKNVFNILISQFPEGTSFKEACEIGFYMFDHNGKKVNRMRHVRCYASVKSAKPITEHVYKSKKNYKSFAYVAAGDLYTLCVYEGNGKKEFKTYSLYDICQNKCSGEDIYPLSYTSPKGDMLKLTTKLHVGDYVLFYKDCPEELYDLSITNLGKRLYVIKGFESDGPRIVLEKHIIANAEGKGSPVKDYDELPKKIRQSASKLKFIVNGVDFNIKMHSGGNIIEFIR